MGKKLFDLVQEFRDTYALKPDKPAFKQMRYCDSHDAVHVLTGFGIGLAEELRVGVVESFLSKEGGYADGSFDEDLIRKRQQRIFDYVMKTYTKGARAVSGETGLGTARFRREQARTQPLKWGEIRDLLKLSRKIDDAIKALTGKRYAELNYCGELGEIDFSKVDFTREAARIKRRYQSSINKKTEEKSLRILFNAARKKGQHKAIPAPGSPWHGPLKKAFGGK